MVDAGSIDGRSGSPVPPSDELDADRVAEIFDNAQSLDLDARNAYIEEACRGAPSLLEEVRSLLDAHASARQFLAGALPGSEPAPAVAPPSSLAERYDVLELLAVGGMGEIFKVRHRLLDQVRVAKIIRSELKHSKHLRKRFEQEARVATRLHHASLAQVFDFHVEAGGEAYLVMEYIDGWSLRRAIETLGKLERGLAVEVGLQVLDALGYLHENRLVHRDVSPDNIMLGRSGEGRPHARLIDFGIVKSLESGHTLTQKGLFVGKVLYSPPEVFGAEGQSAAGAAGDLYALGIVLYELLTGHVPIVGADYRSIISGHLVHPPRSFEETDPEGVVPPELRCFVLRLLEKRPVDRPASASAAREELVAIRDELRLDVGEGWDAPFAHVPRGGESDGSYPAASTEEHAPPAVAAHPASAAAAPGPSRRRRAALAAGLAIALLGGAVAMGLLGDLRRDPAPAAPSPRIEKATPVAPAAVAPVPAPLPAMGQLRVDVHPWARIDRVLALPGREPVAVGSLVTPCVVDLPAGSYLLRLSSETAGLEMEEVVSIEPGGTSTVNREIEGFDVERAIAWVERP